MGKLFNELRRRNVLRVAAVYTVVGWLLLQVSRALEAALTLPGWFDTVVAAGLLVGFPLALLLAWAFELTPEGVKPTGAVPAAESITPLTGRKLDYIMLGALALVGLLIVGDRLTSERPATGDGAQAPASTEVAPAKSAGAATPDKSIAVLPFADMSAAKDQEYFADGISKEILNVWRGCRS